MTMSSIAISPVNDPPPVYLKRICTSLPIRLSISLLIQLCLEGPISIQSPLIHATLVYVTDNSTIRFSVMCAVSEPAKLSPLLKVAENPGQGILCIPDTYGSYARCIDEKPTFGS